MIHTFDHGRSAKQVSARRIAILLPAVGHPVLYIGCLRDNASNISLLNALPPNSYPILCNGFVGLLMLTMG